MATRSCDVLCYGATGYTGRAVCQRLALRAAEDGFTWAIAGRSASKLQRLAAELRTAKPFIAPADDLEALTRAFDGVKVVINCAGPYALCSSNVVAACVAAGANYVDVSHCGHVCIYLER